MALPPIPEGFGGFYPPMYDEQGQFVPQVLPEPTFGYDDFGRPQYSRNQLDDKGNVLPMFTRPNATLYNADGTLFRQGAFSTEGGINPVSLQMTQGQNFGVSYPTQTNGTFAATGPASVFMQPKGQMPRAQSQQQVSQQPSFPSMSGGMQNEGIYNTTPIAPQTNQQQPSTPLASAMPKMDSNTSGRGEDLMFRQRTSGRSTGGSRPTPARNPNLNR